MPIAIGAKNVFVAAPKTLQYPNAATNKGFKPVFRGLHHECLEAILRKS